MVNPILKILNSKLVIMSEYQNIKAFLQKTKNEIGWKIFFFYIMIGLIGVKEFMLIKPKNHVNTLFVIIITSLK